MEMDIICKTIQAVDDIQNETNTLYGGAIKFAP